MTKSYLSSFMKILCVSLMSIFCFSYAANASKNVIVICAHPDDCEITAGGLALLMTDAGCKVKFVSVTNGNKGHQTLSEEELAKRRYNETVCVKNLANIEYEVLNIPDGELVPSLENRLEIIRLIREWKADLVITHRPSDYHPDHRNVSILVQDAAFMVTVPKVLPSVPALSYNPVFLYTRDRFTSPRPFRPDIVVDVTPVMRKKAEMIHCHASQVYEWLPWLNHTENTIPTDEEERINLQVKNYVIKRGFITKQDKKILNKFYGKKRAQKVQAVEAIEFSEYGKQLTDDEIKEWFPIFD